MKKCIYFVLFFMLIVQMYGCSVTTEVEVVPEGDLNKVESVNKNDTQIVKPVDLSIVSQETKVKYLEGDKAVYISPLFTNAHMIYYHQVTEDFFFQKYDENGQKMRGFYTYSTQLKQTQEIVGLELVGGQDEDVYIVVDPQSKRLYLQVHTQAEGNMNKLYVLREEKHIFSIESILTANVNERLVAVSGDLYCFMTDYGENRGVEWRDKNGDLLTSGTKVLEAGILSNMPIWIDQNHFLWTYNVKTKAPVQLIDNQVFKMAISKSQTKVCLLSSVMDIEQNALVGSFAESEFVTEKASVLSLGFEHKIYWPISENEPLICYKNSDGKFFYHYALGDHAYSGKNGFALSVSGETMLSVDGEWIDLKSGNLVAENQQLKVLATEGILQIFITQEGRAVVETGGHQLYMIELEQ